MARRGRVRPGRRGDLDRRHRGRARAAAVGAPSPFGSLHRRFRAGAAHRDGREAGDRGAPPHRELPPARRVRAAAIQGADSRGSRRALGARSRDRSLPRARRPGARGEPSCPDRPRRGSAAALLLDWVAAGARHGGARDAEEHAALRPRRGGATRAAGHRSQDRRVRMVVGARRAAGPSRRTRRLSAHAQAARPSPGRPCGGRGHAAPMGRRRDPLRRRGAGGRARMAVRRGSVPAVPRSRARPASRSHRLRRPAGRRHRVVVSRGARCGRAVDGTGQGLLVHAAVPRRSPEDGAVYGLRRRVRGHDARRAARGILGPLARRVRGRRPEPARVGRGRIGLPRIHRGQDAGEDPHRVPGRGADRARRARRAEARTVLRGGAGGGGGAGADGILGPRRERRRDLGRSRARLRGDAGRGHDRRGGDRGCGGGSRCARDPRAQRHGRQSVDGTAAVSDRSSRCLRRLADVLPARRPRARTAAQQPDLREALIIPAGGR